jgi:hypothetical protein
MILTDGVFGEPASDLGFCTVPMIAARSLDATGLVSTIRGRRGKLSEEKSHELYRERRGLARLKFL